MATKLKFYKSEIANQPISRVTKDGTITVTFIVCEMIAQKFMGVFKTEDAKIQAVLDKIVGTRGLSNSTEEEYEHFLKKKVIHDSHQVYQSKQHLAQPKSNSVASAPASEKKEDEGITLPSTSNPDSGSTNSEESELGDVEQVKGDAPATAANYTQLAAKLSDQIGVVLAADELKALKDRPDAPQKESGKGYDVLQWKAFLTKVAKESSSEENEDGD